MSELATLLNSKNIRTAAIIDDGFDEVPTPNDLKEVEWDLFFADLQQDDIKHIEKEFPNYYNIQVENLPDSAEFISCLWKIRTQLHTDVCNHLFEGYQHKIYSDQLFLESLVKNIEGLGLECTTMGRESIHEVINADLIFVDLFLGFTESENDVEEAILQIKRILEVKSGIPPLVILMSSSSRIWEKRDDFRDKACLLGSTFRVTTKKELREALYLEKLLTRLANHYDDAKLFAAFIHAWDTGLAEAKKRFILALRRLDLSDLAQIQGLLLEFDEQGLGEYLLDVTDRVLQHEIEANPSTIDATKKLNKVELSKYPAPHLEGSADLQDIVYRMLFQHPKRLELALNTENIQFGDLYCLMESSSGNESNNVLLVVTPACDLACGKVASILVLPGSRKLLAPNDWTYGQSLVKTSVFTGKDQKKYWIEWDLKGRYTVPKHEIHAQLASNELSHVGRLREIYAIDIQQKLLNDMARIGQVANPPAPFPVYIQLFSISTLSTVKLESIEKFEFAVCFVGNDEESDRIDHLVLSEAACDALQKTIENFTEANIREQARSALTSLKCNLNFFERFEKGLIEVPSKDGGSKVACEGDNEYLTVFRNKILDDGDTVKNPINKLPFIINVCDVESSSGYSI